MKPRVFTDTDENQCIQFVVRVWPEAYDEPVDFERVAKDFEGMMNAAVNGSHYFDAFFLGWSPVQTDE